MHKLTSEGPQSVNTAAGADLGTTSLDNVIKMLSVIHREYLINFTRRFIPMTYYLMGWCWE